MLQKGLQRITGFESKAERDERDVMKFIMHLGSDLSAEPSLKRVNRKQHDSVHRCEAKCWLPASATLGSFTINYNYLSLTCSSMSKCSVTADQPLPSIYITIPLQSFCCCTLRRAQQFSRKPNKPVCLTLLLKTHDKLQGRLKWGLVVLACSFFPPF